MKIKAKETRETGSRQDRDGKIKHIGLPVLYIYIAVIYLHIYTLLNSYPVE